MTKALRDKGAYSLMVIKEAQLEFFAKVLGLAGEYAAERNCKGVVENVDGGYELIAIPNDNT